MWRNLIALGFREVRFYLAACLFRNLFPLHICSLYRLLRPDNEPYSSLLSQRMAEGTTSTSRSNEGKDMWLAVSGPEKIWGNGVNHSVTPFEGNLLSYNR